MGFLRMSNGAHRTKAGWQRHAAMSLPEEYDPIEDEPAAMPAPKADIVRPYKKRFFDVSIRLAGPWPTTAFAFARLHGIGRAASSCWLSGTGKELGVFGRGKIAIRNASDTKTSWHLLYHFNPPQ